MEKNIARVDITGMRTAVDIEYSNGTVQRVTFDELQTLAAKPVTKEKPADIIQTSVFPPEHNQAVSDSPAPMSDRKAAKEPK